MTSLTPRSPLPMQLQGPVSVLCDPHVKAAAVTQDSGFLGERGRSRQAGTWRRVMSETSTGSLKAWPQNEPAMAELPIPNPDPPRETFTVHRDRTEPNRGQLPGDRYVRVGRRLPGRLPLDGDYHVLPAKSRPRHGRRPAGGGPNQARADRPADSDGGRAARARQRLHRVGGLRLGQHLLLGLRHRGDHARADPGRRRRRSR